VKKYLDITRRQFVTNSAATLAMSHLARASRALPLEAEQTNPAAGGPFRVIIDTYPGVDDALALLLAMGSTELKIEGITAVAGNVPLELTLPNALRMVEIAGRTDIPVAAGASGPLLRRLVTATTRMARMALAEPYSQNRNASQSLSRLRNLFARPFASIQVRSRCSPSDRSPILPPP
jgi:hypothetical protein